MKKAHGFVCPKLTDAVEDTSGSDQVNRRIISENKANSLHHSDEQTIPPQRLTDNTDKVGGVQSMEAQGDRSGGLTRGR